MLGTISAATATLTLAVTGAIVLRGIIRLFTDVLDTDPDVDQQMRDELSTLDRWDGRR